MKEPLLRKLRVLVVDDDPFMVQLFETMLARLDDRVELTSFTSAVEAQHWLDAHRCDLLLTDIEMPEIDGLALQRFAKKRNAWTQVVFVTGHSSWGRVTEALEQGATDYLLKPINPTELLDVVEQQMVRQARWQRAARETVQLQQA